MRTSSFLTSGLLVLCVSNSTSCRQGSSLVNFRHLEHLTEQIDFRGERVSVVRVYSNYPDYEWVEAKESGPEGIACVDDAARASVLYLAHYEATGSKGSLEKAKSLLKFISKMQSEDGKFYNFIFDDHTINTHGKTSFGSFGWWAARGMWAFCHGYRVLKTIDTAFAGNLRKAIERGLPHVDSLLASYGRVDTLNRYRVPRWLFYGSGADVTSELLIGLTEYFVADSSQRVRRLINKLADGLMIMQDGDETTFPHAAHRSWQTALHLWGNGQTQALAYAGKVLSDPQMLVSAEREARGFYSRVLMNGFFKEMDIARPATKIQFDQIAYAVRPIVVGLIRLYEGTSKPEYLKMAALGASWLLGGNVAGVPMYDVATGRCYDGIRDSTTINMNSGAESTIEALYALVEFERYPEAQKYLSYRRVRSGSSAGDEFGVFEDHFGNQLTMVIDRQQKKFFMFEGNQSDTFEKKLR